VNFTGRPHEFRRLVTRGAMLELVTVGFYRFWLATDIRRHLWSHTEVGGDAPEYTGTAKELFIGFLFAMAILAPIYLIYFLAGLEAERLQAFASIPLVLFFYFFAQFAIYRARRYRLTRTVWRGVRFWMTGSGWAYALRAGLWSLLTVFTFGIAYPWRQASLERYKMRHTSYGSLAGRFEGTGGKLFGQIWWLWLLGTLTSFLIVTIPFFYAAAKAAEWRWWMSGIRFGEVRFDSGLRNGAFVGLYWKVIGWSMLLITLLLLWIGAVFVVAMLLHGVTFDTMSAMSEQQIRGIFESPFVWIGSGLGYLIAALAGVAVVRIYLVRAIWERVAVSTTVHNLAAAHAVAAQGEMVSALGEGFADSLDIGGF
jgi:uncharacterized membrane protein YjgN (DUF898 family)